MRIINQVICRENSSFCWYSCSLQSVMWHVHITIWSTFDIPWHFPTFCCCHFVVCKGHSWVWAMERWKIDFGRWSRWSECTILDSMAPQLHRSWTNWTNSRIWIWMICTKRSTRLTRLAGVTPIRRTMVQVFLGRLSLEDPWSSADHVAMSDSYRREGCYATRLHKSMSYIYIYMYIHRIHNYMRVLGASKDGQIFKVDGCHMQPCVPWSINGTVAFSILDG